MRSGIGEARQRLELDVLPRVSDHQAKQYSQLLTEAEGEARIQADQHVAEAAAQVMERRDTALRELAAVRDGYDDLHSRGSSAQITSGEYTRELQKLRRRQQQAEASLRWAEQQVERLAAIEEDPIAWHDGLSARFANMQKEWPW